MERALLRRRGTGSWLLPSGFVPHGVVINIVVAGPHVLAGTPYQLTDTPRMPGRAFSS
jgi:hypothetical protein